MAEGRPIEKASAGGDADFAQAFKDLTKGERTAAALENHLTNLESKIDALLASVDKKDDSAPVTTPGVRSSSNEPSQRQTAKRLE